MPEIYQPYKKLVLNIDQQLELLIKQALLVKNPQRVLHYLRFMGYHRLSGYFRTFQLQNTSEHISKGITFDSILSVYISVSSSLTQLLPFIPISLVGRGSG